MAYATLADMTARFGGAELIRLTAPEGELDGPVVEADVTRAVTEASDVIDSYLRRRYATPLAAPIPPAIIGAACILARFDLAHGEQREPTEQMRLARKETIAWLKALSDGSAELDGAVPLSGTAGAGARVRDRDALFTPNTLAGW